MLDWMVFGSLFNLDRVLHILVNNHMLDEETAACVYLSYAVTKNIKVRERPPKRMRLDTDEDKTEMYTHPMSITMQSYDDYEIADTWNPFQAIRYVVESWLRLDTSSNSLWSLGKEMYNLGREEDGNLIPSAYYPINKPLVPLAKLNQVPTDERKENHMDVDYESLISKHVYQPDSPRDKIPVERRKYPIFMLLPKDDSVIKKKFDEWQTLPKGEDRPTFRKVLDNCTFEISDDFNVLETMGTSVNPICLSFFLQRGSLKTDQRLHRMHFCPFTSPPINQRLTNAAGPRVTLDPKLFPEYDTTKKRTKEQEDSDLSLFEMNMITSAGMQITGKRYDAHRYCGMIYRSKMEPSTKRGEPVVNNGEPLFASVPNKKNNMKAEETFPRQLWTDLDIQEVMDLFKLLYTVSPKEYYLDFDEFLEEAKSQRMSCNYGTQPLKHMTREQRDEYKREKMDFVKGTAALFNACLQRMDQLFDGFGKDGDTPTYLDQKEVALDRKWMSFFFHFLCHHTGTSDLTLPQTEPELMHRCALMFQSLCRVKLAMVDGQYRMLGAVGLLTGYMPDYSDTLKSHYLYGEKFGFRKQLLTHEGRLNTHRIRTPVKFHLFLNATCNPVLSDVESRMQALSGRLQIEGKEGEDKSLSDILVDFLQKRLPICSSVESLDKMDDERFQEIGEDIEDIRYQEVVIVAKNVESKTGDTPEDLSLWRSMFGYVNPKPFSAGDKDKKTFPITKVERPVPDGGWDFYNLPWQDLLQSKKPYERSDKKNKEIDNPDPWAAAFMSYLDVVMCEFMDKEVTRIFIFNNPRPADKEKTDWDIRAKILSTIRSIYHYEVSKNTTLKSFLPKGDPVEEDKEFKWKVPGHVSFYLEDNSFEKQKFHNCNVSLLVWALSIVQFVRDEKSNDAYRAFLSYKGTPQLELGNLVSAEPWPTELPPNRGLTEYGRDNFNGGEMTRLLVDVMHRPTSCLAKAITGLRGEEIKNTQTSMDAIQNVYYYKAAENIIEMYKEHGFRIRFPQEEDLEITTMSHKLKTLKNVYGKALPNTVPETSFFANVRYWLEFVCDGLTSSVIMWPLNADSRFHRDGVFMVNEESFGDIGTFALSDKEKKPPSAKMSEEKRKAADSKYLERGKKVGEWKFRFWFNTKHYDERFGDHKDELKKWKERFKHGFSFKQMCCLWLYRVPDPSLDKVGDDRDLILSDGLYETMMNLYKALEERRDIIINNKGNGNLSLTAEQEKKEKAKEDKRKGGVEKRKQAKQTQEQKALEAEKQSLQKEREDLEKKAAALEADKEKLAALREQVTKERQHIFSPGKGAAAENADAETAADTDADTDADITEDMKRAAANKAAKKKAEESYAAAIAATKRATASRTVKTSDDSTSSNSEESSEQVEIIEDPRKEMLETVKSTQELMKKGLMRLHQCDMNLKNLFPVVTGYQLPQSKEPGQLRIKLKDEEFEILSFRLELMRRQLPYMMCLNKLITDAVEQREDQNRLNLDKLLTFDKNVEEERKKLPEEEQGKVPDLPIFRQLLMLADAEVVRFVSETKKTVLVREPEQAGAFDDDAGPAFDDDGGKKPAAKPDTRKDKEDEVLQDKESEGGVQGTVAGAAFDDDDGGKKPAAKPDTPKDKEDEVFRDKESDTPAGGEGGVQGSVDSDASDSDDDDTDPEELNDEEKELYDNRQLQKQLGKNAVYPPFSLYRTMPSNERTMMDNLPDSLAEMLCQAHKVIKDRDNKKLRYLHRFVIGRITDLLAHEANLLTVQDKRDFFRDVLQEAAPTSAKWKQMLVPWLKEKP